MNTNYFDVFDAISFAVKYLKDRDGRTMRPLIMDAFALAGPASNEDEFIVSLLFYSCEKSGKARSRLESLPLERHIRMAVQMLQLNTSDHIPNPFQHRIDLLRIRCNSANKSDSLAGYLAVSVFCRHISLCESQIKDDIHYYEQKPQTPKTEQAIKNLKSRLEGIRSEKRCLLDYFGGLYCAVEMNL